MIMKFVFVFSQLETLKRNLDLSKGTEDDETVFNNTYQPKEGSPRYTKNRQRERELAEKANNGHANEEESKRIKSQKSSARALPPLPEHTPQHIGQEDAGNISEPKPKASLLKKGPGKKVGRHEKGRNKDVEDTRGRGVELEPEDDLLQEYQQQIVEQEEKIVRGMLHRKTANMASDTEHGMALNNEVGRKRRKKLKSHEAEGEG